jgi:hypothetical protein
MSSANLDLVRSIYAAWGRDGSMPIELGLAAHGDGS